MKIDKFTKAILTIIAVNLTILTGSSLEIFPNAYANELENMSKSVPDLNYGLVPLNEDGSINVRLNNSGEIDVNITDINTSEKLKVTVEEVDRYAFRNCIVPVEMEN